MVKNTIIKKGTLLYKYRAAIAVLFFVVLVLISRPHSVKYYPHVFVLIGLSLRTWAAGYIGISARRYPFSTYFRVASGPYRFVKHPLYIGNFFLVIGVTLLFNPPTWFGVIIVGAFVMVYSMISVSESQYVRGLKSKKMRFRVHNLYGEISTMVMVALTYFLYFAWRYVHRDSIF